MVNFDTKRTAKYYAKFQNAHKRTLSKKYTLKTIYEEISDIACFKQITIQWILKSWQRLHLKKKRVSRRSWEKSFINTLPVTKTCSLLLFAYVPKVAFLSPSEVLLLFAFLPLSLSVSRLQQKDKYVLNQCQKISCCFLNCHDHSL